MPSAQKAQATNDQASLAVATSSTIDERSQGRPQELSESSSTNGTPPEASPEEPESPAADQVNLEKLIGELPPVVLLWLQRNQIIATLPHQGNQLAMLPQSGEALDVRLEKLSIWIQIADKLFDEPGPSHRVARQLETMVLQSRDQLDQKEMGWVEQTRRLLQDHPFLSTTMSLGSGYILYRMLANELNAITRSDRAGVLI